MQVCYTSVFTACLKLPMTHFSLCASTQICAFNLTHFEPNLFHSNTSPRLSPFTLSYKPSLLAYSDRTKSSAHNKRPLIMHRLPLMQSLKHPPAQGAYMELVCGFYCLFGIVDYLMLDLASASAHQCFYCTLILLGKERSLILLEMT